MSGAARRATTGRARRLGRPRRSRRRAATSTSRGPGPSTASARAGGRASSSLDDGGRVLALTRPWPLRRRGSAYVPRGPVAGSAATAPTLAAAPGRGRATALAAPGVDVVAADPEVPAADAAFGAAIRAAGLRADRGDPAVAPPGRAAARRGVDETPRSGRDRQVAPASGSAARSATALVVVRHDARAAGTAPGEGFDAPGRAAAEAPRPLLRPAARDRRAPPVHVRPAGRRSSAGGGPRSTAGHLVYLEVRDGGADGSPWPASSCTATAGGCRPSTRATAPRAATRPSRAPCTCCAGGRSSWRSARAAPRWTSVASTSAGARREPREGEPMYGLYQHKRVVRRPSGSS